MRNECGEILSLGPATCHRCSVLWDSAADIENAKDRNSARIVVKSNKGERKTKRMIVSWKKSE